MVVLVAIAAYVVRILRRPVDVRLKRRQGGPVVVVGGLGLLIFLWLRFSPEDVGAGYLTGEMWGVSAVFLMTVSLVLATKWRRLEPWFGGLDRMYLWHRWSATVAVGLLVVPHAILTTIAPALEQGAPSGLVGTAGIVLGAASILGLVALVVVSYPRIGDLIRLHYGRWLGLHRLTGVLVIFAFLHGLALDDVIAGSTLLRLIFVGLGTVATAAYAYTELLMRRLLPAADAVVSSVRRLSTDTLEVVVQPTDRAVEVIPGQFIYLEVRGGAGRREHPFSVAGVLPDGRLRLIVKAAGRDTALMYERLEPGLTAKVTGPFGMFDHTVGGDRQIWIAAGVGVAPFLGWLAARSAGLPARVDFFYVTSSPETALFAEEVDAFSREHPTVRVHHVRTKESGRLTLEQIACRATDTGVLDPTIDVFLCGPRPMVDDLARALGRRGFSRDHVHFELFAFR